MKAAPAAQKLYSTGVQPQQNHESPIIGAAPPQILGLRNTATASVAPAGSQACVASLLAWRLGEHADPAVHEPVGQVALWLRLWTSTGADERRIITKAWQKAVPRILLGGVHWGRAVASLQATVATLGQLGWVPSTPARWLASCRSTYADADDGDPNAHAQILQAVRRSAQDAVWRRAAAHHLGRGLEEGLPQLEPARKARKWLTRRGLAAEARALDTVLCGGAWHGGRANLRRRCRCGEEETPFHRYWSCGKLSDVVDENGNRLVHSTQWLRKEFENTQLSKYECLWGRGILPRSLIEPEPPPDPDEVRPRAAGNFENALKSADVADSDGSGGPASAPQSSPMVGSGLAAAHWMEDANGLTLQEAAVLSSPAPGQQCVPRAK